MNSNAADSSSSSNSMAGKASKVASMAAIAATLATVSGAASDTREAAKSVTVLVHILVLCFIVMSVSLLGIFITMATIGALNVKKNA